MNPADLDTWEKDYFRLSGSKALLGAGRLANKPDVVIWVEDKQQIDACMSVWAGGKEPDLGCVLALPPPPLHVTTDYDPFFGIAEHADDLKAITKHVLAFQVDRAGLAWQDELARRLGRHKCHMLKFPPHATTCDEIIQFYGPADLAYAVKEAEPYPIDGIKLIKPGETMRKWREKPPMVLCGTGTGASDAIVKFPTDGRLIVVTGIPTMGKSSWTIYVMVYQMMRHNRRFAVYSPEMAPWESFLEHCIEVYLRKPIGTASWDEIEKAEAFFSTRLINIIHDSFDVSPNVDWFLELSEAAVMRHGITDAICDPWNALEHARGRADRDEYVSASLFKCKAWAERFSCNIWIVAHPIKMSSHRPGGELPEPTMYDIKGGSEWYDRADLGFCVHRKDGLTQLRLLKAKFRQYGKSGDKCLMEFDPSNHCFSTPPGDTGL